MKDTLIEFTKDGGFYYRAYLFHYATLVITMPVVTVALLVAVINPFWFRDALFSTFERAITRFALKRNKLMYRIYLGTDPTVWHSLKD